MIEIKNFKNFYFEPESENYPDCGDGAHFSLEQIIEDSTLLSNINNVCTKEAHFLKVYYRPKTQDRFL